MSYQLELERKGKAPDIAMPPLETQHQEVHPELAQEFMPAQTQEVQEDAQVEAAAAIEQPEAIVEEKKVIETPNAKNIRILRERAERAERAELERDQLKFKLQQLESQVPKSEKPTYRNVGSDDFVEGKDLKRYDEEIENLKIQIATSEKKASLAATEAHLKAQYSDLDRVVNKENLEILKESYPEIANSLNANQDLYSKAVAAYTLIKKLGIVKEDHYVNNRELVMKNNAKPKPLASISPTQGESPLSKANIFAQGLTPELKAQLRREMEEARKNM